MKKISVLGIQMNVTLLLFILIGGLPVVLSYMFYAFDTPLLLSTIEGPFTPGWKRNVWLGSVALTVTCYVIMLIGFVTKDLTELQTNVIYPSYMIFLSSASQYVLYCGVLVKLQQNSPYLTINLWSVAIGSIGFVITAIVAKEPTWWLIASASYVAFHHVFLDAIWWTSGFDAEAIKAQRVDEELKLLNLNRKDLKL